MASQLALPLSVPQAFGRDSFIVAPCNARAFAFIETWPHWPVAVVAIFGPAGSGKTHLASIWRELSGAHIVTASELNRPVNHNGPLVVEDVDTAAAEADRDAALFRLIEAATPPAPVLLTGKEPPSQWPAALPDLASRFGAVLSLPLWEPSEELLFGLARKLLEDRQIPVSDVVIARIVGGWERTPAAILDFVAKADAKALAENRPLNLALVRELLAAEDDGLS